MVTSNGTSLTPSSTSRSGNRKHRNGGDGGHGHNRRSRHFKDDCSEENSPLNGEEGDSSPSPVERDSENGVGLSGSGLHRAHVQQIRRRDKDGKDSSRGGSGSTNGSKIRMPYHQNV